MSPSSSPRFGWSIVVASFGAMAVSVGLSMSAYPVFMTELETAFGVSRTVTSFGIPAILVVGGLCGPFVGRAVDRGSPRRIMCLGAVLMTLGLLAVSRAETLLVAATAWLVLVGTGAIMFGPLPAMAVLNNWFVAKRAQMIAIAAMGTTIGGAISPPLSEFLIGSFGWRGAVAAMGVALSVLGIPIVLLGIVKAPEEVGLHPDGAPTALGASPAGGSAPREVSFGTFLGDARFWLVAAGATLMAGAGISFMTHVVPFAMERGLTREAAVGLLTINALMTAAGKLAFGPLTDRLGARGAILVGLALELLGWAGLLLSSGPWTVTAGAACFSVGAGCMIPCQAGYIAGLFGRVGFGRAMGLIGTVSMLGMMSMPPLVGYAFEQTGSYALPMTVMLGVLAIPALLFASVDPDDGAAVVEPATGESMA